ncbi:MAG: hypothetical protein AAGA56_15090 [Myxococcota bacterium]
MKPLESLDLRKNRGPSRKTVLVEFESSQLLERSEFGRELGDLVLGEIELAEVEAFAERGGNCLEFVANDVEFLQALKVANTIRQLRKLTLANA